MAHKYRQLSELEFGLALLEWKSLGVYPMEMVAAIEFTDDKGIFWAPALELYDKTHKLKEPEVVITGNGNGYKNREQMLRCVGRCWDKAIASRPK